MFANNLHLEINDTICYSKTPGFLNATNNDNKRN